jgi:hypothetical protein
MKLLCALFAASALWAQTPSEKGFKPLFDGKTFDGWEGDMRLWKAVNGEIVGSTEGNPIKQNSFLIYKGKELGNFIFRADVKLRNHNSGIQFRSEQLPDYVVKGYQVDIADGNWWGGIYEERGKRGVMVNGWKGKAERVVKKDDWNSVEISCQGTKIEVRVNGLLTAELNDDLKLSGVLALQIHAGPPMEVRFRNIRIKELKK